jgi:hypothetical protein
MRATIAILLGFAFVFANANGNAATEAVTSDGRRVLLDDNGTWKPKEESSQRAATAVTRTTPKSATSVARSGYGTFSFAYDPNKWTVEQHPLSETVEFIFRHASGSGNVKVVTEQVQMTLDGLKKLNLKMMTKGDPKAHIESESAMTVNGNAGLVIDNVSEEFGARWHVRRFLWSGKQGAVQMVATVANNLYDDRAADVNDLIAGFTTH